MKIKYRNLYACVIIAIILFILGFYLFFVTLNYTKENILKAHDDHLYDLGYTIDIDVYDGLDDFKEEMTFALTRKKITIAENDYIQSHKIEKLKVGVEEYVLSRYSFLQYVIVHYDDQFLMCMENGETKDLHYDVRILCEDSDGLGICICDEEKEEYYMMLHVTSDQKKYDYYMLVSLHHFFDQVIPFSIRMNNWIALYDEDTGLLIQNHKNQPSYLVLSKEEIKKREDGYTILMNHELQEEKGAETYTYPNPDGNIGIQRIISLPSKQTSNGKFAIAVAVDSRHIYDQIDKIQYHMGIAALIIALSGILFCIIILRSILSQSKREKEMETLRIQEEFQKQIDELKIGNSMSQMQPHFLYNALSSIREIVLEDPEYASDLIYDFTVHLRSCIRAMANNNLVPFKQELESIKAYANIEKMRFGDRLDIQYEIEWDEFEIVPLSIQPLVENAIRHGVFRKRKGGYVKITTRKIEKGCLLVVEDNGVGFDYDLMMKEIEEGKRDSTGLKNAILRLKEMIQVDIKVNSVIGEGTQIYIFIPDQ